MGLRTFLIKVTCSSTTGNYIPREMSWPFIGDEKVQRVTDYLREQAQPIYEAEVPQEEVVMEDYSKSAMPILMRQFSL